jgi:hypothetical protein
MYFFSETSKTITPSGNPVLGSWNVAGYQQINLHCRAKGSSGTSSLLIYFNNLQAAAESLTIGPTVPGGWNVAVIARTYPVYAPILFITLSGVTTQMEVMLRLYAACCESKPSVFLRAASSLGLFRKRTAAAEGEPYRKLSEEIDLQRLLGPPEQAPSDEGQTGSQ